MSGRREEEEEEDEAVAKIRGMGLGIDDENIRAALRQCNNNPEEAIQVLVPESPEETRHLGYQISAQTSVSSQERDVDMRETHAGSGGESDRDSTTVSYSLDEERHIEEEEEEGEEEGLQYQDSQEELPPGHSRGLPPRYEDVVVTGNLVEEDPHQEMVTRPQGAGPSIEFPLTHFYELESRVHTEQWSIPYKREESLAICLMATTNMIREGERVCIVQCFLECVVMLVLVLVCVCYNVYCVAVYRSGVG